MKSTTATLVFAETTVWPAGSCDTTVPEASLVWAGRTENEKKTPDSLMRVHRVGDREPDEVGNLHHRVLRSLADDDLKLDGARLSRFPASVSVRVLFPRSR